MSFVAIDFETANPARDSACSLAAVTVEAGAITRTAYALIRPPRLYFDPRHIEIHGITPDAVRHKPTFAELWDRIRTHLEGKMVIAHNAAFDIGVLRSVLATYQLPLPDFQYICTVQLARRVWPGEPSYNLARLAERFAISFEHHHALHDAKTCALIAMEAQRELAAGSLLEVLHRVKLQPKPFAG